MTTPVDPPVRQVIAWLTIASFAIAALMGVAAVLIGDFGETEVQILLTTLLIGFVSLAMLVFVSTGGTPYAFVGILGGGVALMTLVVGVALIWAQPDYGGDLEDALLRAFGIGGIWGGTLAQASLLLVLTERAAPAARVLRALTLTLAALFAAATSVIVLGAEPDEALARGLAVVAILDALGTVVVLALGVLARMGGQPRSTVTIPQPLADHLDHAAAAHAMTRDQLATEAIGAYLGHPGDGPGVRNDHTR